MEAIVTERISAYIQNDRFKCFVTMDPITFEIHKRTKGIYIDGPCDIVYRVDEGNPFQSDNNIGKKRVWTLTDSDMKYYRNEQYYDDRLKTIIYIDPIKIYNNLTSPLEDFVCWVFRGDEVIGCKEVKIKGPSRWISNPKKRLEISNFSCSVWVETDSEIDIKY